MNPDRTRRPEQPLGIFDAHLHILDPRFPLTPNHDHLPQPFTVADYRRRTRQLGVTGGAVVSASFQGLDHSYLLDALRLLGPTFVGVTQLPADASDELITDDASDELITDLHAAGVRAVRFNLHRGGFERLNHLETLAHRVAAIAGWHVELYLDGRELPELEPRLQALSPCPASRFSAHQLVEAGWA